MEQTKVCKGICGKLKPLTEFYNHHDTKDGKHSKCKECMKQDNKRYKAKPKEIASKESEETVINVLKAFGIYAAPGKCSEWKWCDIVAWGCVRIEVKTSKQDKDGIFAFSTTNRQQRKGFTADLVILACQWKDYNSYHVFPSNHPVFYISGKMKRGVSYDPFMVARKSGHGGRLTNSLMNQQKDNWSLIEQKRNEAIARLTGNEIVISNPVQQPALFDIPA